MSTIPVLGGRSLKLMSDFIVWSFLELQLVFLTAYSQEHGVRQNYLSDVASKTLLSRPPAIEDALTKWRPRSRSRLYDPRSLAHEQ